MRWSPCIPFLVAALVSGCGGSCKRESRALIAAVDWYRHGESALKPALAQAVATTECTHHEVCDAKTACVAAIDPTARALFIRDEVARRVVDIEEHRLSPDSAEARGLPAKLDEAEKLLYEGRARMQDCEKRLTDLQVENGV